ncbi:NAD-dependent succinate-semialdehyde dehydrogenase [Paremcibacter congregatus]|uniref:Succinate-semialdehyde dehydrogenase n=1 Tax=Paremcibacter congregatus TaxID=2043170 RepID=A0A2G4YS90_9PROT|nr:NAD-dependent succinate-semialdehyde dehydrogenase [Paremcibacter congregatus]PHZ85211.1 succinate-semialdehyde dehydrogenase [Paremcibacter congregatus]QDE27856.1 NAD-dependent succinate-semialdehyde dehydrogenase [Paremcibacter congregatus]
MITAIDPTYDTVIREVRPADQDEIERVLSRAEQAYQSWRKTDFSARAEVLNAVAHRLREDRARLTYLMTEEMGKPVKEAYGEIEKAAWCAEHYAAHAESYLSRDEISSDASLSYVQYLPLGPIMGILPWNAPFWLAFRFCAPVLMAGNTCVMKHDPHVPGCAQAIAQLFGDAGAPSAILQNLPLRNEDAESVIRDDRIRGISFTGSDKAGATVAAIAASEIKPAVLELGGSDPNIVLADADLAKAAEIIALSRIINAGQSCIAAKRIIVEAPVHDAFVALLKERLSGYKLGDPREQSTDVGPLARDDLRQGLHRQVQDTIKAGATCLLGGDMPDGPGFFYPVTLLTDVTSDMAAGCEETFGPVAVVMKARDADHAIEIANDTHYGLGAAVWTETSRGEAIAREIIAGQVSVNGIVKTDPRLPSGGVRRSGYGRELGPQGIHEFVNAQQIWIGPAKAS